MSPTTSPRINTAELAELLAARLQPQLAEINESILRLEEANKRIVPLVDKHELTLYGNGSEGLITRVSHLMKTASAATWVAIVIIGAVLTSAIGTFIYLAQSHPLP